METLTITKKNHLVLNEEILASAGLKAGEKVHIILSKDKIEIRPLKKKSLHGFIRGIDTTITREPDRIFY